MGCFDTVLVPCPRCGAIDEFQSKSGDCLFEEYSLEDCPAEILFDVNRHAPAICLECGTRFMVEFETYKPDKRCVSVRNVRVVEYNGKV